MKLKFTALIMAGLFMQQAMAWSAAGHELVCSIASQNLDATTSSAVNQILTYNLTSPGNEKSTTETNTMPAACTWMDVVTYSSWPSKDLQQSFAKLHYIDAVVTPDEKPTLANAKAAIQKEMQATPDNVINAINSSIKTLMTEKNDAADQAYALRVLVHTIGDLHQPMHSADPTILGTGTRGANSILFTTPVTINEVAPEGGKSDQYSIKELHAFWDGMAGDNEFGGQWSSFYPQVYSPTPVFAQNEFNQAANTLLANYSNNTDVMAQAKDPIVMDWAENANLKAINEVQALTYQADTKAGFVDTTITNDYIAEAQQVANEQLVVGGIHLSKMLNAIFDPQHADPTYVKYVTAIANDASVKPIEKLVPVTVS